MTAGLGRESATWPRPSVIRSGSSDASPLPSDPPGEPPSGATQASPQLAAAGRERVGKNGLVKDPALEGRVVIQFTIGASGKVPVSLVQESTLADAQVAQCIAKAVKRWTFPKPDGGGNVIVTYPFVLEAE